MIPRRLWPIAVLFVLASLAVALARSHAAAADDPRPPSQGSHRALVPTAFHNACPGGAIVDDFSNPGSGWPDFDETDGQAGYVNILGPNYGISLWPFMKLPISRGDRWDNSRRLQVTAWEDIPQNGVFGLALGMNADATDYIAAQIDPEFDFLSLERISDHQITLLGKWPFEESHDGGTVMTVTGDPATGQATLTLDDVLTIPLPDITGHVGLVVSSGRGRGAAFFDDYVFVDTYCDGAE